MDEFAFMMNKQEQKNVLCPATLHAHGVIYLSLNFHHICDIQDRVLCFWWYFLSPKTNAKCGAGARGLRFPYWPPTLKPKNLWAKNFHICTGGVFFNIILTCMMDNMCSCHHVPTVLLGVEVPPLGQTACIAYRKLVAIN